MENMLKYIYMSFEITQYTEFVDYKLSTRSVATDFIEINRMLPGMYVQWKARISKDRIVGEVAYSWMVEVDCSNRHGWSCLSAWE